MEDPKTYPFLREDNHIVPGVDDSAEFQATVKSMKIMGMTNEDFSAIFKIVSAVMLFGTMQFKQDRNSDQATLPDNTVAQKVAHLLGLSITDMTKAFLKPRIKVGRDFVTKSQTKEQVIDRVVCNFFKKKMLGVIFAITSICLQLVWYHGVFFAGRICG